MNKDSEHPLDGFRTDEDDALINYQPRRHRIKKDFDHQQTTQTAILSLCLVTGISAGVGSTFASEKNTAPPDAPALDSVPVQPDVKIETPSGSADTQPPVKMVPDIPAIEQSPDEPSSKNENPSGKKQEDQEKKTKNEDNQKSVEKDQKKAEQVETKEKKNKEKPSNQESFNQEVKQEDKPSEPKQPKEETNLDEKQDMNSSAPAIDNQPDVDDAVTEKKPVIDGGELPQTAGSNLDYALYGSATAALGAVFIRKSRKNKKDNC